MIKFALEIYLTQKDEHFKIIRSQKIIVHQDDHCLMKDHTEVMINNIPLLTVMKQLRQQEAQHQRTTQR